MDTIGILAKEQFQDDVLNIHAVQPNGTMKKYLSDKEAVNAFDFPDDPNKNPWGIHNVPYDGAIVSYIDSLLKLAKKNGSRNQIETSYDWLTIDYIMRGYEVLYPEESREFYKYMREWRRQSTHLGVSREGEALLQHKFNLPEKIHSLIKVIFPKQLWDKKFVNSFASRYGQFKGSDKL